MAQENDRRPKIIRSHPPTETLKTLSDRVYGSRGWGNHLIIPKMDDLESSSQDHIDPQNEVENNPWKMGLA